MENPRYVRTYRWLDLYGRPRTIDILVGAEPTRRVEAFSTEDGREPVLVATIEADGQFRRLANAQAVTYGLDTAAAWNNLIELCRMAHGRHTVY